MISSSEKKQNKKLQLKKNKKLQLKKTKSKEISINLERLGKKQEKKINIKS